MGSSPIKIFINGDLKKFPQETNIVSLLEILNISSKSGDVSLVAIDNLPSILPKESTYDFSDQLEQFLINYTEDSGPIKNSLDLFHSNIAKI